MRVLVIAALVVAPSAAAAETLVDVDERAPCRAVHAAKAPGCWRHVRLRGDRVELVTPIVFEYDKGIIRPGSMTVIEELARLVGAHPELRRIEVQGHNGFSESHRSMRLSDHRARAVVKALVSLGVDATRLESHGYGDSVPLVLPRTDADRRRNTRIELRVAR